MGAAKYPLAEVNYGQQEIDAVMATLTAGQTTCGPQVREFETRFADYVGAKQATMVNSGSSADLLLALSLGEPDGRDEILLPAVTWPTQVWSCLMAGYKVVLVDVEPATLQMSVMDALGKINRNTRAIFLTHLMGLVGNIDPFLSLMNHGDLSLTILEDCCEALGARWHGQHVGTLGDAGAFSFFFSHLISTMEGGMVVGKHAESPRNYRLLRSHGWEPKKDYRYWFPSWGLNVRPTEPQGAFGVAQIQKVDQFRQSRLWNVDALAARTYRAYPEWLDGPTVVEGCEPSWHGFPLMVNALAPFCRDKLCDFLEEHGIETRPIVAGNLARQPAICDHRERITMGHLPGADSIHEQGFYIGTSSRIDDAATAYVGDMFDAFMETMK